MKLSPIKTFIYYFLQFSWGIIQNVIGLLLWLFLFIKKPSRKKELFYGSLVSRWNYSKSLCLGVFIFLGSENIGILKHEYGHSIQSLLLGPLYLIVIGIPSLVWNICFDSYRIKRNKNYYRFYTERWADILGNNIKNGEII